MEPIVVVVVLLLAGLVLRKLLSTAISLTIVTLLAAVYFGYSAIPHLPSLVEMLQHGLTNTTTT